MMEIITLQLHGSCIQKKVKHIGNIMSRLKEISCVPLHRFASLVVFCDLWLLVTVLKMLKVEVGQALLSDK